MSDTDTEKDVNSVERYVEHKGDGPKANPGWAGILLTVDKSCLTM